MGLLSSKINNINLKIGREVNKEEYEEFLSEIENSQLKEGHFKARRNKINTIYSKLKKEYDGINPDLKNLELMDKKGIIEYILVVLNKIKKSYYEDLKDEITLTENIMGQYYLIKLGEKFLKQYKENNEKYVKTYEIFKKISQKYNIFPSLDKLSEADIQFFKLE